jgi:hypothetical protein
MNITKPADVAFEEETAVDPILNKGFLFRLQHSLIGVERSIKHALGNR